MFAIAVDQRCTWFIEHEVRPPLLVWIRPGRRQPTVKRVCDVDAGPAALTRERLATSVLHPGVRLAVKALGEAKIEPTAEGVEEARRSESGGRSHRPSP